MILGLESDELRCRLADKFLFAAPQHAIERAGAGTAMQASRERCTPTLGVGSSAHQVRIRSVTALASQPIEQRAFARNTDRVHPCQAGAVAWVRCMRLGGSDNESTMSFTNRSGPCRTTGLVAALAAHAAENRSGQECSSPEWRERPWNHTSVIAPFPNGGG